MARGHKNPSTSLGAAEGPSHRALGEGQEAVSKYGQMTGVPESSSSVSQSLWQVPHRTTPQPVDVCVRCLRATRDKLPRGFYSISVALHSHLGGPALAWTNKKDQQEWTVSTDPVEHQGHVYDTDLHINQNLVMILPPTCELLPSMVFVFQLIASPGQIGYMKSVLAWGAFPVCGSRLGPVQGRYKTPLLRGEPHSQVDQFWKIEALMSSDLDHWLCNMYFQIKTLPPGTSGAPECSIPPQTPPLNTSAVLQPAVRHSRPQSKRDPRPIHPQSQLNPLHAGPSSGAREPAVMHSPRGSAFHLSADSPCSSSSLPGHWHMGIVAGLECLKRLESWQLQCSEFTDVALKLLHAASASATVLHVEASWNDEQTHPYSQRAKQLLLGKILLHTSFGQAIVLTGRKRGVGFTARLPYENEWRFYRARLVHDFLGRSQERPRRRAAGERSRFKRRSVALISIHQYEYFATSSRKALSPPKGNAGRG
ncbi:uncharacterized protein LOC133569914 [Nerophis ophidion]|uniref:uncharacterized protein LOC133569914 n=1 Tax=Nerophis ophidion TaxID=159077 RepID=UPI002AE05EA4|nr:uncharacterized protein LOC133569914 [Nerophis ophidion]